MKAVILHSAGFYLRMEVPAEAPGRVLVTVESSSATVPISPTIKAARRWMRDCLAILDRLERDALNTRLAPYIQTAIRLARDAGLTTGEPRFDDGERSWIIPIWRKTGMLAAFDTAVAAYVSQVPAWAREHIGYVLSSEAKP